MGILPPRQGAVTLHLPSARCQTTWPTSPRHRCARWPSTQSSGLLKFERSSGGSESRDRIECRILGAAVDLSAHRPGAPNCRPAPVPKDALGAECALRSLAPSPILGSDHCVHGMALLLSRRG